MYTAQQEWGADVVRDCGVGVSGWVGVVKKKPDLKKPFKERGTQRRALYSTLLVLCSYNGFDPDRASLPYPDPIGFCGGGNSGNENGAFQN